MSLFVSRTCSILHLKDDFTIFLVFTCARTHAPGCVFECLLVSFANACYFGFRGEENHDVGTSKCQISIGSLLFYKSI